MEKELAKDHGYYRKFTKDGLSDFKGSHEKEAFFTPAEEGRLLHELLQSVSYEPVSYIIIISYVFTLLRWVYKYFMQKYLG